ncbi:hypothetical protein LguiA_028072 [Lonicera macranthoides]
MVKFGELCKCSMNLRCKFSSENLDLLVSITCDKDLAVVINEYVRASSSPKDGKIRAILVTLIKTMKEISPTYSVLSFIFFNSKSYPQGRLWGC